MTILFAIFIAILLFSVLIFVHELGHFVAAKLSGVQVNEFAMFMGPALFKKQKGETLYSIRCIPIGGYCAMEGEDEDTENPRSFQKAAWWKRLIILAAGSAMNFLAGLLIFFVVLLPVGQFIAPVISEADPGCTIVREDGLHIGDRILKIDGERIYESSDVELILALNPGNIHDVEVKRDGKKVVFNDFYMEKHIFPEETVPRFGIRFTEIEGNLGNTLIYAGKSAVNTARSVRLSLQMLFRGQAGFQDVGGPVKIVQIMSETAVSAEKTSDALQNMLYFGGFIAINLAVMNLLPFPALDGGRIVGLALTTGIEKVTRKKLDPKYEGYVHGAGMILLLALMAIIMFKDIFSIFKG